MEFKVGDWVIHGFDVCQVRQIEGSRVTSVSDGYCQTSGHDLGCYPLTMDNKRIADAVAYWSNRFHKQHYMINYPDLHRFLCDFAGRAMSNTNAEFTKAERKCASQVLQEMEQFCKELWNYLRTLYDVEIMGFRVWGHRSLER